MKDYFKYRFGTDIEFNLDSKDFVSVVGNANDLFIYTLLNGHTKCNIFIGDKELKDENMPTIKRRMSIVLYKHLNIFVGETVMDEIAFGLEGLAYTKDDIRNTVASEARRFKLDHLLERDCNSLGSSDKVKMKILSAMIIKPQILVLDNVLCELDYKDKLLIFDILKEFKKLGGIVINVTNDMEETLYSEKIIVIYDKKLICFGKTLSVLNEEKLLKKIGIGLPFIIDLNRYFMDYGMIDKYYLDNDKLVGALWK